MDTHSIPAVGASANGVVEPSSVNGVSTPAEPAQPPPRPTALVVNFDGIPEGLRRGCQFVLWRYDLREGKWTKPPYRVNGEAASTTDPATWSTFEEVRTAYLAGGWDGIGRVHLPEDNLVGADADKCVRAETGLATGFAAEAALLLDTYTEVSPSGNGLRAFCYGKKPGKRCRKGAFELYDGLTADDKPGGRFLTLTGHHYPGTPTGVEHRQAEVEAVYSRIFGGGGQSTPRTPKAGSAVATPDAAGQTTNDAGFSDEEVLRRMFAARNGAAISRLWQGDTGGHGGDESAADMALVDHLYFWCRGDEAQIDRLFRRSRLKRDKWDEKRGDSTYGKNTIAKARGGKVYTPPPVNGASTATPPGGSGPADPPHPPRAPLETDLGNGIRLGRAHGATLRHVHPWHKWLTWTGCAWRVDDTGEVDRRAKDVVLAMLDEATEEIKRLAMETMK